MDIEKNNNNISLLYYEFPSFFDSPTRNKIVRLIESDGGVISREAFLRLKTKFSSRPDGVEWFAQLMQSVAERNLEIRNKGVLRVVCHIVAIWLRQSITTQAEQLISQIALENPFLYRSLKGNRLHDVKLKSSHPHDLDNLETIHKEEISMCMPNEQNSASILVPYLLNDIRTAAKPKLSKMEEAKDKPKEKSHVYRSIKEAEQKKLVMIKEKSRMSSITVEENEPIVKKSVLKLPKGRYEGEINVNNLPHGKGRLDCFNGETFEGLFEDGKFVRGRKETALGSIFEGEKFVDFRLEGPGTYKVIGGKECEGNFIFGNLDFRSITYK